MQQDAAEITDRIEAELEFVAAAYTQEEAWVKRTAPSAVTTVQRRLSSSFPGNTDGGSSKATFLLDLLLPEGYLATLVTHVVGISHRSKLFEKERVSE